MRKVVIDHPILARIALIDKRFIEDLDPEKVPKDPEVFLNWWWENYAKACEACPLSESRNYVVKPDGTSRARIMIVGEGPGFLEDLTKLPMVGPLELKTSHCGECKSALSCFSNRLLTTPYGITKHPKAVTCSPNYTGRPQLPNTFFVKSAGAILDGILLKKWKFNYPRHNWIQHYNKLHPDLPLDIVSPWFVTNVVLCRTTDITGVKDNPPEPVPRRKCKKWLAFQWAAVNPDLIICFGRIALETLVGSKTAAMRIVPNEITQTKFGPVLFTHHPAYYMRERGKQVKAYGFAKVASSLEKGLNYIGLPTEEY